MNPSYESALNAARRYITAEQVQGAWLIGYGVIALLACGWHAWKYRGQSRGFCLGLATLGLPQIAVGSAWLMAARRLLPTVESKSVAFTDELERVRAIMGWCDGAVLVLTALALAGMGLLWRARPPWRGFGLGLTLQTLVSLPVAVVSQQRADGYAEALVQAIVDLYRV